MFSGAGSTGYDPVARRRIRRMTARARPLLLPSALIIAALILGSELAAAGRGQPADPPPPVAPPGRVLVVVSPADPAVLRLTAPGTVVDVYGASPDALGPLDVDSVDEPVRALLLASSALVMGPASVPGAHAVSVPAPDVLGGRSAEALTLAVTDAEAGAIAAQRGSGLSLALRPD